MNKSTCSLLLLIFALAALSACGEERATGAEKVSGGDPERGRSAIQRYGCGTCHAIPGIAGANGVVGPPLAKMAKRAYIGGVLPNTTEDMMRWLMDPPAVSPKTAMPNMGVTEGDARHITAYLYTLE